MLGLPELDCDLEGRDRKHAAPLHSRSRRGPSGLSQTGEIRRGQLRPGPCSPLVLAIDTAGAACSVAVGCGDRLLGAEELAMAHGQAEALLPMIDRVMRAVPLQPAALDIVAASVGPGSFTGIRVGLAAARGIALACGAPLVGVTAFAATAFAATAGAVASDRLAGRDVLLCDLLLIALESRRADLFVQLLDPALRPLSEPAALPPEALGDFVAAAVGDGALLIAGDAAQRAADALVTRRSQIRAAEIRAAGAMPRAAGALHAALACWRRGERGDAGPLYLRPPAVTLAAPSPRRSGC